MTHRLLTHERGDPDQQLAIREAEVVALRAELADARERLRLRDETLEWVREELRAIQLAATTRADEALGR